MSEKFPIKKPGDVLTAGHINELSKAAKSIRKMRPGSFTSGVDSSDGFAVNTQAPHKQFVMRIMRKADSYNYPGHAGEWLGHIRFYNHENRAWKPTDSEFVSQLYLERVTGKPDPNGEKEWYVDPTHCGKRLSIGDKVVCYWDEQRRSFIPIDNHIQEFELYDELLTTSNISVLAYPRYYDVLTYAWKTDFSEVFYVVDPFTMHKGRKRHKFASPHEQGSLGRAIRDTVQNLWRIVELQPTAYFVYGISYGDFDKDASTIELNPNPDICFPSGAIYTDQSPKNNLTVLNDGFWGKEGSKCEAAWDDTASGWRLVHVHAIKEITVVTNVYCEDDDIVVCTRKVQLNSPSNADDEECPY